MHVLALDWSTVQSKGASRREEDKKKPKRSREHTPSTAGSLTYETLPINAQSLLEAVDRWATSVGPQAEGSAETPVLFVALHACGSLTLDILRAFVAQVKAGTSLRRWSPAAALVVGCCYNLLAPHDQHSLTGRPISFAENHLQMAAQAPSQWCRTPEVFDSTDLSFQKAAWRALLTGIMHDRGAEHSHHEAVGKRLGRINDASYDNWPSFLDAASQKFGVDLTGATRDSRAEGRVEVFQFLRCVLGPVVESFLLLDRKCWLRREMLDVGVDVRLVNLFDQASGSARNVAIVVANCT